MTLSLLKPLLHVLVNSKSLLWDYYEWLHNTALELQHVDLACMP